MNTPEGRSEQPGYGTPPSNEGHHSPTDSPPLDLQSKGLTIEEIREAIREEVTGALKRQKRGVPVPVALGIGLGAVAIAVASTIAVGKVYGDEPIPEPTPASRGIDSVPGGTSFSNDGSTPQLEGLLPHLQNPTNQEPVNPVNPAKVSSNSENKPRSVAEQETKEVNPEEVFDPYAERGVIKDSDILRGVSLETIQEAPMFDENRNPLFFMATPKQGEESRFEKNLVAPGVHSDILKDAKDKNVKDQWRQEVSANRPIPMPLDGYVFLIEVDGGGKPAGVKVLFMTLNNTLDLVNITTDDNRIVDFPIDSQTVSKENGFGKDYKKGLFLTRGELLFRPSKDTTVEYMRQSGEGGTLASRRIPGDIIPLTVTDPATGEKKLPAQ
jgi:hypothetical protein